jgi:hypothetical protein
MPAELRHNSRRKVRSIRALSRSRKLLPNWASKIEQKEAADSRRKSHELPVPLGQCKEVGAVAPHCFGWANSNVQMGH